jgi:hypothetical protein
MSEAVEGAIQRHERHESQEAYDRWSKTRRNWRPGPAMVENAALFLGAGAAYGALGLWVVLGQHVLVYDGLARLSHAYFVWWNAPPKLTAIGFVWPPIATLMFLPFAAIKPLATSLVALPLSSAVFGALLLVMLNRLFTLMRMPVWQRYPLLAAFGANPMIAFYASNGMAEILYLFLLVGAVHAFQRWYLTRAPGALIFSAVFFTLGILSRYEVFTWAVLLAGSIALVSIRQRVSRSELEGTLLTYLAPISYGVGLWLFFNWLIVGSPLFFLRQQTPGAPVSPGQAPSTIVHTQLGPLQIAEKIASLNWHLFPPTIVVLIALAAVFAVRRDLMTLSLFGMIGLNAAFTWLIVMESGAESYFQLRYNMRPMPLALAGVAWLFLIARGRMRFAIWAVALLGLVAAIPMTASTMESFQYQFREVDFMHAVTGRGGLPDQLGGAQEVARYIDAHVHRQDAVLTDDSETFAAMLLTGRPDLFWDRIDRGDLEWYLARDDPWGRVRYMLVIPGGPDLIMQQYPDIASGRTRGFTTVLRSGKYLLVRVAAHRPPPRRKLTP